MDGFSPINSFIPIITLQIFIIILLVSIFFVLRRQSKKEYSRSTFEALWEIEKVVLETLDFEEATKKVVNIILTQLGYLNLGYEVIVLSLLEEEKKRLRRVAISQTSAAEEFLKASPIPFQEIIIPLDEDSNLLVKALKEKKLYVTDKVKDILVPALDEEWVESFQKHLGIQTSIVYPVMAKDKVLGTINFSLSKPKEEISPEEWGVLESFVGAAGIAMDNALLFQSLAQTTKALREANRKLQELDKLKDEFVSIASHELRTPLTVIRSYISLLLEDKNLKLTAKQKEYLHHAYSSTNRLNYLVDDMLNISRIESGRFNLSLKEVHLGPLIEELLMEIQPEAQKEEISLNFEPYHGSIPPVKADVDKIKEVLINFIGNGIKYTPKGGSVTVRLLEKNGEVICEVHDTGIGIKKEDIRKLFTKFGSLEKTMPLHEDNRSTGLGLYLSKSIIELHGGKVWAESEGEGKGSSFFFSLKKA